jgi:hypothetical protein
VSRGTQQWSSECQTALLAIRYFAIRYSSFTTEIDSAMPMIPFGDYRPDLSAYQGASPQIIQNVVPRGDGYGPFADFTAFTSALPAPCRGFFYAHKTDGSIVVFAGTSTKLYQLSNTDFIWTDVSKSGGTYTALPSRDHWQFAQFGISSLRSRPIPRCRCST